MFGVESGRAERRRVDVDRDDLPRAGERGSNRRDSGARPEIDDAATTHELGMVEQMARERLTRSPAEGPVGRRLAVGELLAARLEIHRFADQPERDLGHERRRAAFEPCTERPEPRLEALARPGRFGGGAHAARARQRPSEVSRMPTTITTNPEPPIAAQRSTRRRSWGGILW